MTFRLEDTEEKGVTVCLSACLCLSWLAESEYWLLRQYTYALRSWNKMETVFVLTLLAVSGVTVVQGSIFELQNMIQESTNQPAVPNYSTYGCYCSSAGRGLPLDESDQCCHNHTCCHSQIHNCKLDSPYSYIFSKGIITCISEDPCEQQLCNCDKIATYCLTRNLDSYNKLYRYYPTQECVGAKMECKKAWDPSPSP
ncbi:neutral phospholipase A2 agkistrodotoxin-like [Tachyglossus aculeatus]|uniref:neutral phospholipase A2 agkistrodotoxin-like n=1 Tax=Tachyglossus aculeatus TaxID=9261 RepID=UPI0018F53872|nr:neutral phospholipase A2 agkistrodotoxin-like [Tachyglossus aculeatus]